MAISTQTRGCKGKLSQRQEKALHECFLCELSGRMLIIQHREEDREEEAGGSGVKFILSHIASSRPAWVA